MSGTERRGTVTIEVLEQLCSRMCHDMAGPVGAIRNGLELINDAEDQESGSASGLGGGQALELIIHSAEQAARRLRLFRLAYGRACSEGVRSFTEIRETATDWLAGGRVTLQWPTDSPDDALAARPGLAKSILNLIVLASEAIPQGGVVTVLGEGGRDSGRVVVAAAGRGVRWPSEQGQALAGRMEAAGPGPRAIHAAITGRLAEYYGLCLSWDTSDTEHLALRLSW